jgi:tyrosyl-tRNA synthetase
MVPCISMETHTPLTAAQEGRLAPEEEEWEEALPPSVRQALDHLCLGAAEVIHRRELGERLARSQALGQPLCVKLGVDPSRPDLHLGHAVVLRKLRLFQELGHRVVLLIGDFTGRVGDPSGKSATRPQLTAQEVEANARTYLDQVGRVLDLGRTEVRYNSEWLAPLDLAGLLHLMSTFTVARLLEREDFARRMAQERPIHLHEFLYPLMQAYDSVALRADVELGGIDQKFNLMAARQVQREYGQPPEVALLMPLLVGLDGREKMSKSLGNDIPIHLPPDEMYGRLMSVPDSLIVPYLELAAGATPPEVEKVRRGLKDGSLHPMQAKAHMARAITAAFWGDDEARRAEERFDALFRRRDLSTQLPEAHIPADLVEDGQVRVVALLTRLGMAPSAAEARRLLRQGAVRLGEERPLGADARWTVQDGAVLRVGRHRFVRLRWGGR